MILIWRRLGMRLSPDRAMPAGSIVHGRRPPCQKVNYRIFFESSARIPNPFEQGLTTLFRKRGDSASTSKMKTRIKKISPLQTGKVLAVVHALFGVVMLPILLLAAIYGPGFCPDFCPEGSRSIHLLLAVVIPLVYVAGGFFGGIICAIVYNLVARWVGGMEVEFEEQGS